MSNPVTISNSNISRCDYGISVDNTQYDNLQFTGNTIAVNWPGTYGAMLATAAIRIVPPSPAATGTVKITDNDISTGRYGIQLDGAVGCTIQSNIFRDRPFGIGSPGYTGLSVDRTEISVTNGSGHTIAKNSLRGNTIGGVPVGGGTGKPTEYQYGLSATTSTGNSINCNITGNQYAGFRFVGNDASTLFRSNTLSAGTDFSTGVSLEPYGGAGAIISQQGVASGSGHDNDFSGTYNVAGGYRTYCQPTVNGYLSPFLYRNGNPATPTPNGGISPITIANTAAAGTVVSCSPALAMRMSGSGNMGTNEEPIDPGSLAVPYAIAADSLYGPNTAEQPYNDMLRFVAQRYLYSYLDERPTLRTSAYPALSYFYQQAAGSDYALLYQADRALQVLADTLVPAGSDSALAAAQAAAALLAAVHSDDVTATYEAQLRLMSLGKLQATAAGYSEAEKATILNIANMCPGTVGPAVYMARNMSLGWLPNAVYDDSTACSGSGSALMRGGKRPNLWQHINILPTAAAGVGIYSLSPNPTGNSAVLRLQQGLTAPTTMAFYDITGRLVTSVAIPAAITEVSIDLNRLAPGLYLYHDSTGNIKGKLIKK